MHTTKRKTKGRYKMFNPIQFLKESLPAKMVKATISFADLYTRQEKRIDELQREIKQAREHLNMFYNKNYASKVSMLEQKVNSMYNANKLVDKVTEKLATATGMEDRIVSVEDNLKILETLLKKQVKDGSLFKLKHGKWSNYSINIEQDFTKFKESILREVNEQVSSITAAINARIKDIRELNKKVKELEKPKRSSHRSTKK